MFGPRVEICGGIASGKTTLAQALAESGHRALFEAFEDNPFWEAFYRDPVGNAFETEVSFLLQHYHAIKEASRGDRRLLICDHALLLDRAYALTTLAGAEVSAFFSVYEVIAERLPPPILIIHLCCDPAEELSRVRHRGRRVEASLTATFLTQLNAAIELQLCEATTEIPTVTIDSERLDFREAGPDRARVVAEIKSALRRHGQTF